ncbi:MAG: hypothetical protein DHS20C05_01900 [Hyphococcus sp.]|nr:MAG: hypothetical protein DHS20C05_01900 [Marinicaulis sp.]
MRTLNKFLILLSAAAVLTVGSLTAAHSFGNPALVQAALDEQVNQSFKDINAIKIQNFTGRLDIVVGGKDTKMQLTGGEVPFPLEMTHQDGALALKGPERPRNYNVYDEIEWRRYHEDAFVRFLAPYPSLTLTIPRGVSIELDDVITIARAGDTGGALKVHDGLVEAVFGNVNSADLNITRSGDIVLGNVEQALVATIKGSGDVVAKSAASAALKIAGSGDIVLGDIGGDADMSIQGSGDIDVGDIGGSVNAVIRGSGDIETGRVLKGGDFVIRGSGDITAQSANGPVTARISGNGDIDIEDGRAENLQVSIHGSGDFRFGGVSTNLNANVNGSGSIDIAENEGTLNTSGRGEFRIGDTTIDHD